jgi:outer membrane autotransporter protein
LTAFYEISFSNANNQKLNLEARMDDIHAGSSGFSSNMKVNGAAVETDSKTGIDGKAAKSIVEPVLQPGPENRWGVWVTGFGDFVNVDADWNAKGYNFTSGGVSVGLDFRITDQLAIGLMGEYAHAWTDLKPTGHIDVDSGRGGIYATWYHHGIYLNGAIYGGHSDYDSSRSGLGGLATSNTEGTEWSGFVSGGYDCHVGHLTVDRLLRFNILIWTLMVSARKGHLLLYRFMPVLPNHSEAMLGSERFISGRLAKSFLNPP